MFWKGLNPPAGGHSTHYLILTTYLRQAGSILIKMNRVWIYQADRFLTDQEVKEIDVLIAAFVKDWTAHGSALAGKGQIVDNLFLVLEVDEELARVTGCSVDKSVYFIKGLEQKFSVGFFDRMNVAYRDGAGQLQLVDRTTFSNLIKDGTVQDDTIVYNNLVQTIEEMNSKWKVPFGDSWHSKVFMKA